MKGLFKNYFFLIALIIVSEQLFPISNSCPTLIPINRSLLKVDFGTEDNTTKGCRPFSIQFLDSSFSTKGKIISWKWYFGDGDSSSLQNPIHVFWFQQSYDVTLKISTDSGYTDQITKTAYIKIAILPKANFIASPQIATLSNPQIEFINRTSTDSVAITYSWFFDDNNYPDGGTSNAKNPSWKFSDTGHYMVLLVVKNEDGCPSTMSREILIIPNPNVLFPTYYFHKGISSWDDFGPNYYKFYPVYVSGVTEMYFEVFNLSGQLLFSSNATQNIRWEATYLPNNSPAPNALYIVRVKYLGFDNIWYSKTQKIVLQR